MEEKPKSLEEIIRLFADKLISDPQSSDCTINEHKARRICSYTEGNIIKPPFRIVYLSVTGEGNLFVKIHRYDRDVLHKAEDPIKVSLDSLKKDYPQLLDKLHEIYEPQNHK